MAVKEMSLRHIILRSEGRGVCDQLAFTLRTGAARAGRRGRTAGFEQGERMALLHGIVTDPSASGLTALQRVVVMMQSQHKRRVS